MGMGFHQQVVQGLHVVSSDNKHSYCTNAYYTEMMGQVKKKFPGVCCGRMKESKEKERCFMKQRPFASWK